MWLMCVCVRFDLFVLISDGNVFHSLVPIATKG